MAAAAARDLRVGGAAAAAARGGRATWRRRPPPVLRGRGSGGSCRPRRVLGVGVAAAARGAAAEGVAAPARLGTGAERVAAAAASDSRAWGVAAAAAHGGCATWRRRPPPVVRGRGSGSCRHHRRMRGVGVAATAQGAAAEGVAAAHAGGVGVWRRPPPWGVVAGEAAATLVTWKCRCRQLPHTYRRAAAAARGVIGRHGRQGRCGL